MSEQPGEGRRTRPEWIGGAILIALGLIFLLNNLTAFQLDNWWALFILIPAVSSFQRAYAVYQSDGRLSAPARGPLIGGIVLTFVALVFLFEISFGALWPLLLIGGGLLILLNAVLPN